MDTYGDHLLYCERIPHRFWRHDAHVKLLARDLAKAARHPVVEETPVGRHMERPDIRALGSRGGTELFDVKICHPLSQARIRDVSENPRNLLKAAWTANVSGYAGMVQAAGTEFNLLPVPLSTLGSRGTRTLIRRYALSQLPLRQGDCAHFPALGASCSSATPLLL